MKNFELRERLAVKTVPSNSVAPPLQLVSSAGAAATLSAHGAQLLSWQLPDAGEQLYLSPLAQYRDGVPIRGGIPVIFPQFAGEGPLPKHGFARCVRWSVLEHGRDRARLRLTDRQAGHRLWPFRYVCDFTVALSGSELQLQLDVENADDRPFTFTAALHSYLRVAEVGDVSVTGLQHLSYRDTARGAASAIQTGEALQIGGEIDRIYFDVPETIELHDGNGCLSATSSGFRDVVVWNPGAEKAPQLKDLDPQGWRRFVCIEPAVVGAPIQLTPGSRWIGRHVLTRRGGRN
jgi:glucose-6-phosphate 1-epimerase